MPWSNRLHSRGKWTTPGTENGTSNWLCSCSGWILDLQFAFESWNPKCRFLDDSVWPSNLLQANWQSWCCIGANQKGTSQIASSKRIRRWISLRIESAGSRNRTIDSIRIRRCFQKLTLSGCQFHLRCKRSVSKFCEYLPNQLRTKWHHLKQKLAKNYQKLAKSNQKMTLKWQKIGQKWVKNVKKKYTLNKEWPDWQIGYKKLTKINTKIGFFMRHLTNVRGTN